MVFSPEPVEKHLIDICMQAALLSPSAMNIQPWRYVCISPKDEVYMQVFQTLMEGNRKWAKDAPVLVLAIVEKEYLYKENMVPNSYAMHDLGMANMAFMIQAQELGLRSHPIGGFDKVQIKQIFSLPETMEPVLIIAVGFPGKEEEALPEIRERQLKPRARKEQQLMFGFGSLPAVK
ncbi:MAG: nitroreductase family protein [Ignavibacteria bacterium]|nr:nitroreductase family protein [Ignavibacteria bacterium]